MSAAHLQTCCPAMRITQSTKKSTTDYGVRSRQSACWPPSIRTWQPAPVWDTTELPRLPITSRKSCWTSCRALGICANHSIRLPGLI